MEAQLARRETSIHSKVCNGWPDHARPREQTKERTNGSAGGFFLWPLISPSERGKSEAEFPLSPTRKLTHVSCGEKEKQAGRRLIRPAAVVEPRTLPTETVWGGGGETEFAWAPLITAHVARLAARFRPNSLSTCHTASRAPTTRAG